MLHQVQDIVIRWINLQRIDMIWGSQYVLEVTVLIAGALAKLFLLGRIGNCKASGRYGTLVIVPLLNFKGPLFRGPSLVSVLSHASSTHAMSCCAPPVSLRHRTLPSMFDTVVSAASKATYACALTSYWNIRSQI
jgi:hypothetical protein